MTRVKKLSGHWGLARGIPAWPERDLRATHARPVARDEGRKGKVLEREFSEAWGCRAEAAGRIMRAPNA